MSRMSWRRPSLTSTHECIAAEGRGDFEGQALVDEIGDRSGIAQAFAERDLERAGDLAADVEGLNRCRQ
ncbi:MAG: hypothetical protein R3C97_14290 [Geminicoccaceae bacterium]